MSEKTILIIDDEPDIRELIAEILEDEGYQVSKAANAAAAREALQRSRPDLVMLDIWMPDTDGISLLREWTSHGDLHFPVVMMSGHGTVETAVEATRMGAVDFIEKPISLARLLMTLEKAFQYWDTQRTHSATGKQNILPPLVGQSDYVRELREQIARVAEQNEAVVIVGPSGSGRSSVAEHLHAGSARAGRPCIQVRADVLDTRSAAVELLGGEHAEGASIGLLEQVRGGTLILNEIEELSAEASKILLGAIERGSFRRLGGRHDITLDMLLVCTAEEDPRSLLERGILSTTMGNYLGLLNLQTQPLANHREDIPALLEHFVNWFVEWDNCQYRHFDVSAQNSIRNHDWHGDIGELQNFVKRLLVMGDQGDINAVEIQAQIARLDSVPVDGLLFKLPVHMPLREARSAFERAYLEQQLKMCEGRIGELATRTGMERTHLYRKLRALDIDARKGVE